MTTVAVPSPLPPSTARCRATTQVGHAVPTPTVPDRPLEYKEAFALFDKKGAGAVPRETLGDLLRALGQNPTQAEVADIVAAAPRDVDYKTFLTILNRPDGFKPAGTPGATLSSCL